MKALLLYKLILIVACMSTTAFATLDDNPFQTQGQESTPVQTSKVDNIDHSIHHYDGPKTPRDANGYINPQDLTCREAHYLSSILMTQSQENLNKVIQQQQDFLVAHKNLLENKDIEKVDDGSAVLKLLNETLFELSLVKSKLDTATNHLQSTANENAVTIGKLVKDNQALIQQLSIVTGDDQACRTDLRKMGTVGQDCKNNNINLPGSVEAHLSQCSLTLAATQDQLGFCLTEQSLAHSYIAKCQDSLLFLLTTVNQDDQGAAAQAEALTCFTELTNCENSKKK